jgi:prevent-host-death family protein
MIREAPAMTVRQNLGELLNEVQYRNGRVLITKAGKPIAALVGVALFERIRKLDDEFDAMAGELAKAFAGSTPDEGGALIDEALRAARKPKRGR